MNELLAAGLAHHHAGRFAEAEQCCRQLLAAQPGDAEGLHLLGLLAQSGARFETAIDLISRAIEIAPANATYRFSLGGVSRDAGRLENAALAFTEAIRIDPRCFEACVDLAAILIELKRPSDAVAACDRAIAINPDHAPAHYNRGNANRDLGLLADALRDYDTAIRLSPDFADAHANRGITLGDLERWREAVACHERAIALRPATAAFHYNLGVALRAVDDPTRAIEHYDQCLALDPGHARGGANRANALTDVGRIDEALTDLDAALRLLPDDPEILYNRGVALEKAYRYEAALADYRQALSLRPAFAECAHNFGLTLLLLGRYEQAWPWHEWRFQVRSFPDRPRGITQPRWTGDPLNGRALLVHAEQGFGDSIQFSRFIAAIGGGRVILEVPRPLTRLMNGLPGVDQVIARDDPLPPFDVYCPMMSLPAAFGTGIDSLPPPSRFTGFGHVPRPPVSEGIRIGIVWSGNPAQRNDRNRSMPLRAMSPLLKHAGSMCSLQTFVRDTDRPTLDATEEIIDLGAGFQDFADTAAAIESLDLVISVDTSVAHLAASLGKPTWVLLAFQPDWRWLLEREDCPWYPSARLFRQSKPGDWDGVIAQVGDVLRSWRP